MRYRPYKHITFERNASMRHRYAKITFLILISFLALFGSGCGEKGADAGPGSGASITLTLGFTGLPADGVSSGVIQATVQDTSGGAVMDGTRVAFTTTLGTFRNGAQSYSARTEGGGVTLSLMAGTTPGIATITATCNGVSQSVSVPIGGVASILLSAQPASLPANGVSSTTITASLMDSQNLSVPIGTQVTFTTSTGTFQNGTNTITAVTTTNAGTASVALMAPATAGIAEINAESMGVTQQIKVEFYRALPPATLTVRAVPTVIHPFGTTRLTATVKDPGGYPIVGETVIFSVLSNDGEGALATLSVITNVNGEAGTTYTAGSKAGTDIIGARTASNGVRGSVSILVDPTAIVVGNLTVISGSASLVADGASQTLIRATVTGIDGNPASGKRVNFTTTAGTLTAASAVTDSRGMAEVRLRSSRITGTATVRAESDGFIASADVLFVPGPASWILMHAFPDVVNPGDAVNIEAAVMDVNNNRLHDERVKFLVRKAGDPKILNTFEQVTDDDGVVRINFTAFHGEGLFEVTASTINGTSATVTFLVDKDAIVVGSITVVAGTDWLPADRTSSTAVRATVIDKNGKPAKNMDVTFSTTLGILSSTTATTDKNGMAEVVLRADITAGTATITADSNGWKARTTVLFKALSPDRVLVEVIPGRVIPSGATTVQATLVDVNNNPIADEQLNFQVTQNQSGGTLAAPTGTTDANGQVRIVYTAGHNTGFDIFKVTANSKQSVSGTGALNITTDGFFVGWITLTSSLPSIPADNVSSTAITATVYDSTGNPVPKGTVVIFRTDLGRFANGQQQIIRGTADESGVVATTLIAGTAGGVAEVTATCEGVTQAVYVFFDDGTVVVGQITLTANPPQIPADGVSSTTIRAVVQDSSGNPVPKGTTVIFNTNLGTFPNGATSIALNIANTSGIVNTSLIAGLTSGLATVTATCGGVTQAVTVNIVDTIIPMVGSITLTSTLNSIPADGFSSTGITATVMDTTGTPMPQGTSVTFTITPAPPPVLATFPNGTQTITLQTAGTTGVVTTSLIAGTAGGVVQVTAESEGVTQLLNIIIDDGSVAVGSIVLTANPTSIPADGTSSSAITAVIRDTAGKPVPNGTPVVFTTDMGTFANSVFPSIVLATVGTSGTVTTSLIAGLVDGVAQVMVTAGNLTQLIEIPILEKLSGSLNLTANPTTLAANGTNTSLIRATMRDSGGNPMPNVPVTFSTTLGTIIGGPTVTTNASGIADVTLRSSTTTGTATVTATASGITATVNVKFTSGAPHSMLLTAAPSTVHPLGTSTVTATLRDINGNPLPGETINFNLSINLSGASLSTTSGVTNNNGQATITYTAGTTQPVTDQVRAVSARDTSIVNTANILVDASATVVGSVTVTSGASSLPANGTSTTLIRATVRDTDGNLAPGISVTFATTLGSLVGGPTVTTNASGIADVTLRSSTTTGTATVTATASGFIATVNVAFVAGAPNTMLLTAAPSTVHPRGTSTVTATLRDINLSPLPGETITFILTINASGGASLSAPSAVTDINGQATITYTAGTGTGTDRVRARSVTDSSITRIVDITVDASAIPVIIGSLVLTASKDAIVANNTSLSVIRATVRDIDGKPVVGKAVSFTRTYGTLSAATANTNASGFAEVTLRSTTQTAVSLVTASIVEGFSDQVQVKFVPGPPVNANSSITVQPASIPANGVSEATVTVTLADTHGNPVLNGTPVNLYASRGTITTANPANTASGRATFTIRAPFTPGTATIYLLDYPDIASTALGFGSITSGAPASILIQSVSQMEIAVTGVGINDNTAITVRIADETGTTVVDPDLSLKVTLLAKPDGGEFISGEQPGGGLVSSVNEIVIGAATGVATFNLRSGVLPGVVEIRIEVLDSGVSLSPPVVTVSPQISIASGPPHTMALSAPTLNAVVNLNAGGDSGIPLTPGFYSRRAGLIVTDRYGNAVPDGTVINLGVLDSVISAGTTGDTVAGNTRLRDAAGGKNFSTDTVTRGVLIRGIEPNDRIVLLESAGNTLPAADKSRFVDIGGVLVSRVWATKRYTATTANIKYAVGASLIGGAIYGTDGTTATKGTVRTKHGLAQLRLVYPANRHTIHVGGYDPGIDTRYSPLNSARVITVFTSSDDRVSMVDEGTLIFSSIAGWKLDAIPNKISSSVEIALTLVDGGDEVPLPFIPIAASILYDKPGMDITVTVSPTDVYGKSISTITVVTPGASGDKATITYYAGDAKVEVEYKTP